MLRIIQIWSNIGTVYFPKIEGPTTGSDEENLKEGDKPTAQLISYAASVRVQQSRNRGACLAPRQAAKTIVCTQARAVIVTVACSEARVKDFTVIFRLGKDNCYTFKVDVRDRKCNYITVKTIIEKCRKKFKG